MNRTTFTTYIRYFMAAIWLINGLFCKVLNQVPRHEEIVGKILALENPRSVTLLIGLLEIGMVAWILSKIKIRVNGLFQIVIVITMNIIEAIIASELLLWGPMNVIFAMMYLTIVYYYSFVLIPKQQSHN